MSVAVVSDRTIEDILQAVCVAREYDTRLVLFEGETNNSVLADRFKAFNIRCWNNRYSEKDVQDIYKGNTDFHGVTYRDLTFEELVQCVKSIACLMYQCDSEEDTPMYKDLEVLESKISTIAIMRSGTWDQARWLS